MNIAVIITSHNRREKTLRCLRSLTSQVPKSFKLKIFLTDDGSTDGTSASIKEEFPDVIISQGNGNLFYSKGTNLSWKKAIDQGNFDGYLLLNDDTEIINSSFWKDLKETDSWCYQNKGTHGIYAGATKSYKGEKTTYGGSIKKGKIRKKFYLLNPNGKFQECSVANGNLTYISCEVVKRLGCYNSKYTHAGSDYDYTYTAYKSGFPIILMPNYSGRCDNDHKNLKEILLKKTLKERINYLYSPVGMGLKDSLLFQKRHSPHLVIPRFFSYWFRALFPYFL